MPRVSIVAAVGKNRAVGATGKLLWYFPSDLARFKATTLGHPIIMGRKTHESIGRVLPGRTNIVVTRDAEYSAEGCEVVHSLDEAFKLAKQEDAKEIFVIGGGEIYKAAWPSITRLYITEVDDSPEADVFFPDYSDFTKVLHSEPGEEKGIHYVYKILERS